MKSVGADPLQLVPAIRAQVAAIDPNQPIHDVSSMSQVLFDDLASTYVLSAILSTIGLIALVLSAAGIYALVSHSVAQRRREIGVRMALGARPDAIVRMIVAHSTRPVAVGSLVRSRRSDRVLVAPYRRRARARPSRSDQLRGRHPADRHRGAAGESRSRAPRGVGQPRRSAQS